ncbi:MAG: hypothetical protein H6909_01385 [Rickettsiaceae bacterium]|nr:hypothetical protein [Rickettsiaceae bacterium]
MKGNSSKQQLKLLENLKLYYSKLWIFIVLFLITLILIYAAPIGQFINKLASHQDPQDKEVQTEALIESALIAKNNFNVGPEPLIVPMKPQLINDELLENSYLSVVKDFSVGMMTTKTQKQKCNINALNHYILFLANANQLLIKLYEGDDYSQELIELQKIEHPQEIQEILKHFESLIANNISAKEEVIKPFGNFLSNFIKVTKKKETISNYKVRIQLIKNNINILTEYLYSPGLQEKFIKYQNF